MNPKALSNNWKGLVEQYKHTQFGTVIAVGLALAIALETVVFATLSKSDHSQTVALGIITAVTLLLILCIALFYKLTVEVTDTNFKFTFGIGLIRKQIPLAEISTAKPVKNRLWHGWGIHRYSRGWLYNVSGFDAVEVILKSGRQLRIGTDEPEKLCRSIEGRLTGSGSQKPLK